VLRRKNIQLEEHTKRTQAYGRRCFSHPVVRIFSHPKVRKYFEDSETDALEFGDLQFILCRRKPKREKWRKRWSRYFTLFNGLTGLERYNFREHLHQDITRHQKRFPGVLKPLDGKYALSPASKGSAMKDLILFRLDDHSRIVMIQNTAYFGIDPERLDDEDSEFFDKSVLKPLMKVTNYAKALKRLWLRAHIKEFLKKFEDAFDELPEKDKGYFIGYVCEHIRWSVEYSDANSEDFQYLSERIKELAMNHGIDNWNKAETYMNSIAGIMSEHRRKIESQIQEEFEKSKIKDSRFKIVSRALKKLAEDDLISRKECKWLRLKQRMSKMYSKRFGDMLTSRALDRTPLIVVEAS
ncbi:MAG: hypothetical protein ACE5IO_09705, partial [Thermoplasmata archaeon]